MISKFFIDRPIFAIGPLHRHRARRAASPCARCRSRNIPRSRRRRSWSPATYPGANAQTIAETVAAPLEQQINGVENMIYMRSTSTGVGHAQPLRHFQIGTNPDQATINVNNRVQRANALLPEEVRRQGVTVRSGRARSCRCSTMSSPDRRYDTIFISNYAADQRLDELTPHAGGRRRHPVRRLRLLDADLAPARQGRPVRSDAKRHRRVRSASRTRSSRPAGSARSRSQACRPSPTR